MTRVMGTLVVVMACLLSGFVLFGMGRLIYLDITRTGPTRWDRRVAEMRATCDSYLDRFPSDSLKILLELSECRYWEPDAEAMAQWADRR